MSPEDQAAIADLRAQLAEGAETLGRERAQWIADAAKMQAEIDQLRVQLAGCGVAAMGGTREPVIAREGDYGWSPTYQSVLDLRIKYDAAIDLGTP